MIETDDAKEVCQQLIAFFVFLQQGFGVHGPRCLFVEVDFFLHLAFPLLHSHFGDLQLRFVDAIDQVELVTVKLSVVDRAVMPAIAALDLDGFR